MYHLAEDFFCLFVCRSGLDSGLTIPTVTNFISYYKYTYTMHMHMMMQKWQFLAGQQQLELVTPLQ